VQVGWEPKAGEGDEQRSLRARLLLLLGYTGNDPEAQKVAKKVSEQALENMASVDHDLAFIALRITARNGDQTFYDKVLEHLKNAKSPEEMFLYQQTLTSFTEPALVQKTLDYAMSPEVRSQDSPLMLGSVLQHPETSKPAWDFVRAHWSDIEKLGGAFAGGVIVNAAGSFCSTQREDEVKDFFANHPTPSAERTLKQSLERIGYCVDTKARQGPQLAAWLSNPSAQAGQ
jgi:aminopeptidase N/puromycin-sensitive aminopeptidase